MDRKHYLYSYSETKIEEFVAFYQEHVGGSKGSLYGDALRARLVAAFPDSTPDLGGEDEPCVPATSRDWSIVSDICTSFTDVAIGVVNDIMEGRVEDSGLATRPSDWMASVRSAMEFDAKLESIAGRTCRMTDVFFKHPSRTAIVTRRTSLRVPHCRRNAVRNCWSSSVAALET